jgi:pyruvate/2-oxoglutarate/acetoin dehydrogenase E1 component
MNNTKLFSKVINNSIQQMLVDYPEMRVFGEDIRDPYGGAFGITQGLTTLYPDRIFNTPISEAGVFGFCFGMASEGIPVMMELMFGDFSLLIMDQLHNNASKLAEFSESKNKLILRTPMGGYRGYGPTHSQSLHRFLVGSENIDIVTSSNFISPYMEYKKMFNRGRISIYLEDKMTYQDVDATETIQSNDLFSITRIGNPYLDVHLKSKFKSSSTLIVCVGSMLRIALEAASELFIESEIAVDIYQVNSLWPINISEIARYSASKESIIFLEEGWVTYGITSEILATLIENKVIQSKASIMRLGSKSTIIPAGKELENRILPVASNLVDAVRSLESGIRNE